MSSYSWLLAPRMTRRRLLRSSLALGAFVLPKAKGHGADTSRQPHAKGVILLMLEGGMSHLESWDPKPDAPAEVRGEFDSIVTAVPGLRIGEYMPRLAKHADLYNVVRSVHCDARNDHSPGMHLLLTGWENTAAGISMERSNLRHPAQGSILTHLMGATSPSGVPNFVGIPRPSQLGGQVKFASASFLGVACEAFETGDPPQSANQPAQLPPGLVVANDFALRRLNDRMALRQTFNRLNAQMDQSATLNGMNSHYQEAYQVLAGQGMCAALDLSQEPAASRERYGDHAVGQSLLLAKRLVEAGATYVLVNPYSGNAWDFHTGNFTGHKKLLPPMDQAVSALLGDLDQQGKLDDVLVLVAGEMGRSPIINGGAGRDHWTQAYSLMAAGGGLTRGQILGSTTSKGEWPGSPPITVSAVLATLYHQLGIDPNTVLYDQQQRPMPILPAPEFVPELIA